MAIKRMPLLCGFVFASFTLFASAQPPSLSDALISARYPLTLTPTGFTGSGAHILGQAIDNAQFVAIGEDHLTREIPEFTARVCDEMAPHGLDALAMETGAEAARFVESTLGKPDRIQRMKDLQQKFPESIAFVSDEQEDNLVEHCFEATRGTNFHVWGLDQEFLGSAGWLIQKMVATRPGPKALAALAVMQSDEKKAAANAIRSGSVTQLYLFTSTDEQIATARAAIETDGEPETHRLFGLLTESRSLYQQHRKDYRASNGARATLLKKNFLRQYIAATASSGSRPRVLVKLGDTHLYKGFNELGELNLGNFLSELADVSGGPGSLHILVLGVSGVHATYGRYGKPLVHTPFVMDQDDDYRWLTPAVKARLTSGSPNEWTLYDLRQLRFGRAADLDKDWRRVVYGYDLLVLIPQITPADLLH